MPPRKAEGQIKDKVLCLRHRHPRIQVSVLGRENSCWFHDDLWSVLCARNLTLTFDVYYIGQAFLQHIVGHLAIGKFSEIFPFQSL